MHIRTVDAILASVNPRFFFFVVRGQLGNLGDFPQNFTTLSMIRCPYCNAFSCQIVGAVDEESERSSGNCGAS